MPSRSLPLHRPRSIRIRPLATTVYRLPLPGTTAVARERRDPLFWCRAAHFRCTTPDPAEYGRWRSTVYSLLFTSPGTTASAHERRDSLFLVPSRSLRPHHPRSSRIRPLAVDCLPFTVYRLPGTTAVAHERRDSLYRYRVARARLPTPMLPIWRVSLPISASRCTGSRR